MKLMYHNTHVSNTKKHVTTAVKPDLLTLLLASPTARMPGAVQTTPQSQPAEQALPKHKKGVLNLWPPKTSNALLAAVHKIAAVSINGN